MRVDSNRGEVLWVGPCSGGAMFMSGLCRLVKKLDRLFISSLFLHPPFDHLLAPILAFLFSRHAFPMLPPLLPVQTFRLVLLAVWVLCLVQCGAQGDIGSFFSSWVCFWGSGSWGWIGAINKNWFSFWIRFWGWRLGDCSTKTGSSCCVTGNSFFEGVLAPRQISLSIMYFTNLPFSGKGPFWGV